MPKQTLNKDELDQMVKSMVAAEIEADEENWEELESDDGHLELYEDDGQPDEYTEWQDYYGGDDWDHGQYDSMEDYFDGGTDF